jgi:hypothetical protein
MHVLSNTTTAWSCLPTPKSCGFMTGLEPSAPPLSTPDKSLGWHRVRNWLIQHGLRDEIMACLLLASNWPFFFVAHRELVLIIRPKRLSKRWLIWSICARALIPEIIASHCIWRIGLPPRPMEVESSLAKNYT